jgi:hypothetical protein
LEKAIDIRGKHARAFVKHTVVIKYITEIIPQRNTDVQVHSGRRFIAEVCLTERIIYSLKQCSSRFIAEVGSQRWVHRGSRLVLMVR